ncbi:ABC transporter ATP-binding protein [Natrinema salsiterrestre]|uniref:ABC transporter ATP-binding protein n=1 Tax=Natrinema salsiterrestre TaxID=2950540 RepID=A0A9Q4L2P7_9EURY|nr:ABC transporter ATP-binding protein [Natrinema salsiterrestre]MDF9747111.1 ABC transporter ATP-binding protein [Natrinema salsiterrestre]
MTAIRTRGLTKRYGSGDDAVVALEGLDLEVADGEVFGFLGPNGAGKTTTIDLLLDFVRPTEGAAMVHGYDTQEETDAVRDRVGVLPEGFDLWHRSSGYRHLEFAIASQNGDADPAALLERVGLDRTDGRRPVGDYSKGMLQRLAMAMALAGDPAVLVLDEPSGGLDPHGIRTMQEIVREEAERGTTVFFSSHILGQVAAVCDRVGILDDGELVTVDTIEGLRETAGVGSRLVLETAGEPDDAVDDLSGIEGVTDVTRDADGLYVSYTDPRAKATVVHRLVESDTAVLDFDIEEATLEDLFAAFTGTGTIAGPDSDSTTESAPAGDVVIEDEGSLEADTEEGDR